MTVGENLAFPLKNRGVPKPEIDARVAEIARLLDLTPYLARKATRLTADAKQKISLGRGLVRSDVAAVLFDEPLTVIDPELKWQLRSKLKALHRELDLTMIYVTHDQTEALTFADTVVVMHDGRVVQSGTPAELFDKPEHTFVGYFIGSPGMNIVPAEVQGREARIGGHKIALNRSYDHLPAGANIEVGVRPEFVTVAPPAPDLLSANIERIDDLGRVRFARVRIGDVKFAARVPPDFRFPGDAGRPEIRSRACTSMPTAVSSRGPPDGQDHQPKGLVPGAAGVSDRGVFRDPAADDGGELFDAGHLRQQPVLLERRRLVQGIARSVDRSRRTIPRLAGAQPGFLRDHPGDRGAARHRGGAVDAARRLARRGLPRDPRAAAADSVERGRHHLADFRAARHRPDGLRAQQPRASTTTTSPTSSTPGPPSS